MSSSIRCRLCLPPVEVVAHAALGRCHPGTGDGQAEIGRGSLGGDWLDGRQAGEGDVQQALADLPGCRAGARARPASTFGAAQLAENLVLLDGIPLFSAVHYSGAASAVDPDAVAGADLHTGVSPARFGDHLAGVVELETRDPGPDAFEARGSLGPGRSARR